MTAEQKRKIVILNEAQRLFSEYLDFENDHIIMPEEADAPKYIFNPTKIDNHAEGEAITNQGTYLGHWINAEGLKNGSFSDLLATWLHETSHKIAGDGEELFNKRLEKLEE